MLICPPQLHINLHVSVRAGFFPISTLVEPGIHGAAITGTQGIGVNTPSAADVALDTDGLAKELHIPKGRMFFIGTLSIIVATGLLLFETRFSGVTTIALGAAPKVHISCAPIVTKFAIPHLQMILTVYSGENLVSPLLAQL
jgi:hypothetical protein